MQPLHLFDGDQLSIERIANLAKRSGPLDLDPDAWSRVAAARALVERQLAAGARIYGTNTGVGSQKEVDVATQDLAAFSNRMIISEASDFPGPAMSELQVRAALLVLINTVAGGRTGMRPALVQRLLQLYAAPRMPTVRADSAYGVADLTPLSQLGVALLGGSLDERPPVLPTTFDLAPKESVSLIDNNSFALGDGALVLAEAARLLGAFDLAAATALEGFRGGLRPLAEQAAGGYRGEGQARSRRNVMGLLQGSILHESGHERFLQDPLSFRSIVQIHGAAYEVWDWARTQFEREINSSADNPLVDVESGELFTSSSMVSLLPALSMDSLRQALAKVSLQSMERALKLQSPPFTGLPVGLAGEGAADGGIVALALNYVGSARMGSLLAAAAPVLLHYVGHTADGVEDVTSLLPLSVSQTRQVIDRAWEAVSLEMAIAVWAMARRRLALAQVGEGPRRVYDLLLPLLHIGEEGTRVFNMRRIVSAIRDGDFVERCLSIVTHTP